MQYNKITNQSYIGHLYEIGAVDEDFVSKKIPALWQNKFRNIFKSKKAFSEYVKRDSEKYNIFKFCNFITLECFDLTSVGHIVAISNFETKMNTTLDQIQFRLLPKMPNRYVKRFRLF